MKTFNITIKNKNNNMTYGGNITTENEKNAITEFLKTKYVKLNSGDKIEIIELF